MKGNVRLLSGANWNVQRVWGGAQEIRSRDKSTKNCLRRYRDFLDRNIAVLFYLSST